jgi:NitT/TauT family transport system substrate-binding protein
MPSRSRFLTSAAAAGAVAAAPAIVRSQQLTEVLWGVLGASATEWPEFIAEAQGYYRDEGLKLTTISAGSPQNVIQQLATGSINLASVGSDSVIAANSRGLAVKGVAPGFNPNPYSLLVPASIKSWADLKGKSVILGTKQDVTALAFGKLAQQHKMTMDDFSIVIGGNSGTRYAALLSGNVQGAILGQPFDIQAQDKGMHVLASASDVLKNWQFTFVTANTPWADKNRDVVVRMLRAYRKSILFGYAKRAASIADLAAEAKFDPAILDRAYELMWVKLRGFDRNLKINQAGFEAVAQSQLDFGAIKKLPVYSEVYDPSFAAAAVRTS